MKNVKRPFCANMNQPLRVTVVHFVCFRSFLYRSIRGKKTTKEEYALIGSAGIFGQNVKVSLLMDPKKEFNPRPFLKFHYLDIVIFLIFFIFGLKEGENVGQNSLWYLYELWLQ
jgi:hypothetical protein